MLKIFSFALLIISFVLISCAKKDGDSKTATATTYATSTSGATASGTITLGNYSISGTYATVCFSASDSTVPTNVTHMGFVAVVTSSDSYRREINYYKDSTCTAESLSLGWYYKMDNVTDQGPTASDSTANEKVSYTEVEQVFMATTDAADTFITGLWSAYSIDFEVGTAKVLDTGFFNYNLIKVQDDGSSDDGSVYFGEQSTSAYPSTVSSSKYVKQ